MKKITLDVVVFVCGASTMILELVGSRIMAPYVGTSIIVWTNIIGVVLASLSLGYAWGGKLADKRPEAAALSFIILGAGVWVFGLGFVYDPVLVWVQSAIGDVRVAALAASSLFFAIPALLMGMVLPYAVKLKIQSLNSTGSTVGGLYALSTLGSIAGTFLTGFVLLAYFGNTLILFALSAFLVVASLLASRAGKAVKILVLAALTVLIPASEGMASFIHGSGLVDVNTPYSRVWVYERAAGEHSIRFMQINDEFSSLEEADTHGLAAFYTRYYRLCGHFFPDLKQTLMLGGAAYSYPKDFLARFPGASMDVVEIDPGVTALAREYFALKADPRLNIYHEDARTYLNQNQKKYDVIFSDVFRSSSIPHHLTTLEAIRRMHDSLGPKGVLMINVIGSISGDTGSFFRAELATIKKVFGQVYVFGVRSGDDAALTQNLMVVALKTNQVPKFYSRDLELHKYLMNLWIGPIEDDMPPLTDDFAPVERYMASVGQAVSRRDNPIMSYWKNKLRQKNRPE